MERPSSGGRGGRAVTGVDRNPGEIPGGARRARPDDVLGGRGGREVTGAGFDVDRTHRRCAWDRQARQRHSPPARSRASGSQTWRGLPQVGHGVEAGLGDEAPRTLGLSIASVLQG